MIDPEHASYDQPSNDFDAHEHGEDASSAAYDADFRGMEPSWKQPRNLGDDIAQVASELRAMRTLLSDLLEYFEDRADADYSDEMQRAVGNEEMRLAMRIRAVLGKGEPC